MTFVGQLKGREMTDIGASQLEQMPHVWFDIRTRCIPEMLALLNTPNRLQSLCYFNPRSLASESPELFEEGKDISREEKLHLLRQVYQA